MVWILATTRTEAVPAPDTRLSGTFWLHESFNVYRPGAKLTGIAFIDELNVEIIFFDEYNIMRTDRGQYVFLDDVVGTLYYGSIESYKSLLRESLAHHRTIGDVFTEEEMRERLFMQGGLELLFRLEGDRLDILGGFSHEEDIGISLFTFRAVTPAELREVFTAYR